MSELNLPKRVRCLKLFGVITKQSNDGSWLHTNGDICYYNDAGDYHREDGPAVTKNYGLHPYWYLNGDLLTFEEWCVDVLIPDERKMMLRLQYG